MTFNNRLKMQPIRIPVFWCVLVLAAVVASHTQLPHSSAAEPFIFDSQSADSLKQDALRQLPFVSLTPEAQSKIRGVVDSPSYFRRMPQQTIECDPQLFKQFVRYPELLIGVWDAMGATKVQIERTAPYFFNADDGSGTRCQSELLYGNDQIHVYYSKGDYTGKLFPKAIDGRSVCVLHSSLHQSADGRNMVTVHFDVFLKVESIGADLVVRTLGPLMGATADQNYSETLKFLSQLSDVSVTNPFGVRGLIERIRYVQPTVKEKFISEVYLAADRASKIARADGTGNSARR